MNSDSAARTKHSAMTVPPGGNCPHQPMPKARGTRPASIRSPTTSTAAEPAALTEKRWQACLLHLAPAAALALVLVALEGTSIDQTVSDWFYDATIGAFPLRNSALLEIGMHHGARLIVVAIGMCAVAALAVTHLLPSPQPYRRLLLFVVLAMTLAPLSVTLIKVMSTQQCPWNLVQYGGFTPYFGMFDAPPPGIRSGHCFPAGHAATGFCLMAFYFVGRAVRYGRLALLGLFGGIAAGLALGFGRIAQGAHFLSHVLWAGIVCWVVIAVLYAVIRPDITEAFPSMLPET